MALAKPYQHLPKTPPVIQSEAMIQKTSEKFNINSTEFQLGVDETHPNPHKSKI
jgi:hypothetical protein